MQQSQPRKKPLRRLILTLAGEGGWALACHLPLLTNVLASAHHAVVDGRGSLINGQKKREEFRQSFCREPPECWRAWNPLVFQFVWAASQFRQTWRLHVRTKHQMLLLLYLDFRGGWLECLVRALQLPDWQWLESHRLLNVTLHHGTEGWGVLELQKIDDYVAAARITLEPVYNWLGNLLYLVLWQRERLREAEEAIQCQFTAFLGRNSAREWFIVGFGFKWHFLPDAPKGSRYILGWG